MSNNQAIQAVVDLVRGEISGIHTSAPGTIVSYDSGTGRASVQPLIKFNVTNEEPRDFPIIVNVPIYFLGSPGRTVTVPIKPGDGCWLFFAERSIDDWLLGGESEDPRKYDLTDCSAIVGMERVRSTNNEAIEIICGSSKLSIAENGDITSNTNLIVEKNLSVKGNVSVEGSLTVKGSGGANFTADIIVGGISFLQHVHGGIQPGGGTTSTPS